MKQNILTTYCLVSINYFENDQQFYLTNKSFIRDNVYLTKAMTAKDFQNTLFYVQTGENQNQIKSAIEFGQKVVFRHKISNRYLSHSDQFQEQENDTTYKLKLSHKKHQFKILPCFQYQTKISNKIRFNEDIHLVTQINGAKTGYLFTKPSKQDHIRTTILGINQHNSKNTSKFSFHFYYQRQKQIQQYIFGSIFWISHIESTTFLSTKTIKNKKQLAFQPIQYEKDLQSINGLWLIQSENFTQGGKIQFQSKFRLKNLSTGSYLSFSGSYRMNQNQRIYNINLDQIPTEKSSFIFKSLKGEDNIIKKNSYLILRHQESKLYIGCRKNQNFSDTQILKPFSYSQFSDQDLYKIIQLDDNEDEALRFVLSIGQQLQYLQQNQSENLQQDTEIFINILKQLQKLKKFQKLLHKIQGQTQQYIPTFSQLLKKYRNKVKRDGSNTNKIMKIIKLIYQILIILITQNRKNQQKMFNNLYCLVDDIFLNLGVQNLLIQTFKSNYKVLTRASKAIPNYNNKNIIQVTLEMVSRFSNNKDSNYWQKILKILQFFFTLIFDGQGSIDINQRIISEEFFVKGQFVKIFFGIKITNHRIKIQQESGSYAEIQRISNPIFTSVLQQVFKIFSLLCFHRNFIAKTSIHDFLSAGASNNIEIMIAYLNMPISQKLLNSLFSLITNLYIDSSPRINRQKPLSVINFVFPNVQQSKSAEQQEVQMSQRLHTSLLNKMHEQKKSRPLMISNLLALSLKLSLQPTLSYDQLNLYKQEINQKLRNESPTIDLLRSVKIMIRLESYTEPQIIQIFKILKKKLQFRNLQKETLNGIMQILLQIAIYTREVELKKLTAYLKYKFLIKQQTINYEKQYIYLLPFENNITPSIKNSNQVNQIISQYNHQVHVLRQLEPDQGLKKILLNLMISDFNSQNYQYIEQIYNCLVVELFNKKSFIQLIINSIVVTQQETEMFNELFELFKKLNHLTAISEYWLSSSGDNIENFKSFIKYMIQIANFLHQSYEGSGQNAQKQAKIINDYTGSIIKEDDIYVNRQLLLRNIGFHKLVLEILQSNYFLLEIGGQNNNIVKAQQIFSLCFQFIYGFIYNCRQTKQIIHKAWNILDKFQNLPQVGQTRVYRELYKNKIQYIRQIKKNFIERILNKILKNPRTKTNEGCEFNPQYLRYLESIVKINGVCHRLNLQKFYRLIQKDSTFKKILFGIQKEDGKIQLCLDMFQIKTQGGVQIPFIYHMKILGLICDMVSSLDSQSTIIKSKLRNIFSLNYLLRILAQPDIYSHTGLQAQMRFLLKKQVKKLVLYFIQRNDSIHLLHDNQEVINLLDFYYKIFIQRAKKIKSQSLNQALYLPYFIEYKEEVQFYQNNQRKYFTEEIIPFLQRMAEILKKTQKNIITSRINQILQQYDDKKMVQYFQYRKMGNQFDKVSIRWLNFVDRDQNNSPEQKFAKLSIVDLLRHPITKKVLEKQNQEFYSLISNETVKFVDVLIKLISENMQEQYKQNQSQTKFSKIYDRLVLLRKILLTLPTRQKKAEQIIFLLQNKIIQNFINFTIKLQFDFSKTLVRKIYHQIIKIFIFILSNSQDNKPLKQMYRCLSQNPLCYRFWSHLSESILTLEQDIHIYDPLDQVNWCLSNIYLNGENRDQNIYRQCFLFVQQLCQYGPFTKFLRYQPLYPSKDFLQILYHTLSFILVQQKTNVKITVPVSQASQIVLNCILSLMIGRNQINQNFIIDSKFPQILNQVMKIQSIKKDMSKANQAERQRLVIQVIQFYEKNGIDLSGNLRHKISVLDFSHSYVLNRLKYTLLRTIIQSVAGNQRSLNKLKFQIPIQLIKINLIWVYQQFKTGKFQFTDEVILRDLQDWEQIVEVNDINGMFLMTGFYLYYLIQSFTEEQEEKNEDQQNAIEDNQKRKQKLVSKFFNTISQKDKKKEKLDKLQKQPFADQMKKYYESYYEALGFFQQKTLTIQVNFHGQLTKIYFPKIPICERMTQQYIQQFKSKAVRISQEEKIKSMLQFQQQSYDNFNGEQKFIKKFHNFPLIAKWFNIVSEDRLKLLALISCFLQTILFFIQNSGRPSFLFQDYLLVKPSSGIQTIMIILGVINLYIGVNLFIYLVFKKIPILWEISGQKQKQRDQSQRQKFSNGRYAHMIKQIMPEVSITSAYILFLVLSFVHPFFGAFILFDVMNRLQLGRQVLRSVKQTWFQLLMATILLIMFNYLFALYVYIQFSPYYAPACQILYQCLLLLVDQSLKSGSGFYGTTNPIAADFVGLQFDLSFFSQMVYIIIAQKVMLQIFSGTIIDKFSELRQQADSVQQDENSMCFICGQERFVIDFQLQGFEQHVSETHNALNYIFYLYYLRKQSQKSYGIIDKYVYDCQLKKKKNWIPNETSILKQQKQKQKQQQKEQNDQAKILEYIDKKVKDIKQIRSKNAMIISELKLENTKNKKA